MLYTVIKRDYTVYYTQPLHTLMIIHSLHATATMFGMVTPDATANTHLPKKEIKCVQKKKPKKELTFE